MGKGWANKGKLLSSPKQAVDYILSNNMASK